MKQGFIRSFALVLALLLCASAVCLSLTGCHGSRGREGFTIPEGLDPERQYEISFWAKNDTNKTQVAVYRKAIADFEALYPNIKVNILLYTDYGAIYNDVITNISTNTTPNVCITYPDHIATYMTGKNVMVPLDALASDPRWGLGGSELKFDGPTKDEIVPAFLRECYIGDTLYALPFMRSTEACYINKTYVERMGYTIPDVLTWDWIFEVADAACEKDENGIYKVNGQSVMIPFIYKSTDNMVIQMLAQKGIPYSDADGSVLMFNDDTRSVLYDVAGHVGKGAFSTFKIIGYPANYLNAGQCLFCIDSTAGATWVGPEAPLACIAEENIVQFETVVRPVPQYDPAHPLMISQGPSVCLFNKEDPGEVLASWLFLQFLLTNDVQMGYAETEGYVPVTTKAQTDPAYLDYLSRGGEDNDLHYAVKIAATELLIEAGSSGKTFTTAVFNGSASLRSAAGQLIENVTKGVRRKQVVDDAFMDKTESEIIAQFRLDQLGSMTGGSGKADLGPLPAGAKALLWVLGGTWVLLGAVFVGGRLKKVRKK